MFSFIAVMIFNGLGLFFLNLARHMTKGSENQICCHIIFIFSLITAGIWLISATIGAHTCQIRDFTKVEETKAAICIYEEQKNKLTEIVKNELMKYPQYEQRIMSEIKSDIFLQFPNLKSNETMLETVNKIFKLEVLVYDTRIKMLGILKDIRYREISPWVIWVKSYKNFFGESNPLVKTESEIN